MKFQVSFKTPDATSHVVEKLCPHPKNAARLRALSLDDRHTTEEIDEQDIAQYEDELCEVTVQVKAVVEKFVRYDEYVTLEFDTVAGTAIVIPVVRSR